MNLNEAMNGLAEAVAWQDEINALPSPPATAEMCRAANATVDKRAREVVAAWNARVIDETAPTPPATLERLRAENSELRLLLLGGEDAPGYADSLTMAEIRRSHADHLNMLRYPTPPPVQAVTREELVEIIQRSIPIGQRPLTCDFEAAADAILSRLKESK